MQEPGCRQLDHLDGGTQRESDKGNWRYAEKNLTAP